MKITIERLTLDELQSFLHEQAEDTFPDLKDGQRLKVLSEKWYSCAECCTCRNDEGCLVGIIVFYANQPQDGVVYIPHVYVRSEYRGQKLMSSMMQMIEKFAKGKKYHHLRLEVKKENKVAQKAYLHYGFSYIRESSEKSLFMQYEIL